MLQRPDLCIKRWAITQLPRWLQDYNDNRPHEALRMKLLPEFIRTFVNRQQTVRSDGGSSNSVSAEIGGISN